LHARVTGGALHGVDVHLVRVEADISSGLPATRTVGLPEAAAREGNERVRSAIRNSGLAYPCKRIVVNLAPADVRKRGSSLDLAMAVAIVAGAEGLDLSPLGGAVLYAELGLDGAVRPVPGALAAAVAARAAGLDAIVVAEENATEAAAIDALRVLPARSLLEVIAHARGESALAPHERLVAPPGDGPAPRTVAPADLLDVRGQLRARRALEIAAAGGHNLLMVGPPGAGKTMLARCLPGILPPLTRAESIEVTRIHGAVGTGLRGGLITERPFRSPHHTVSIVALSGGGTMARPGEISLAHHGVLFLDELPEFRREAIEALRQPLEEGAVVVARAARTLRYPASFMLVAAMNPCPCGHLGDPRRRCLCTPPSIERYRSRISGPLLDRIDLHVEVPGVPFRDLAAAGESEPTARVALRVAAARAVTSCRQDGAVNARLPRAALRDLAALHAAGRRILEPAMSRWALPARAHDRILRVARTIADLEGGGRVGSAHLAEAVQYRCLDRDVEAVATP